MELTQQQKAAIQEAADHLAAEKPDRFVPCDYARRQGVIQGMTEVITNPSKYGLYCDISESELLEKAKGYAPLTDEDTDKIHEELGADKKNRFGLILDVPLTKDEERELVKYLKDIKKIAEQNDSMSVRIEQLEAENQRYKEALERIISSYESSDKNTEGVVECSEMGTKLEITMYKVAQQALKGGQDD